MNTTAGKGASSPPPRRRPSARAPGEADSRERRARSAKRESAGEIYAPERGEVFFEEKPQPFSVSLREILEEYRSDSGPDRYAMAVELEEPPEGEEALGPETEPAPEIEEPLSARAALHAYWDSKGVPHPPAEEPPRRRESAREPPRRRESERESPRRRESERESPRRRQESRPARPRTPVREEPVPEVEGGWNWMDIVNEFKMGSELESSVFDERPRAAGKRQPMTHRDDLPAQAQAEEQGNINSADALPAGIRPLQGRRSESAASAAGHLSFEEIMAEFGAPIAKSAEAPRAQTPAEAEAMEAPSEHRGRRSHMEDEARALFAHLDEMPVKAESAAPAIEEAKAPAPEEAKAPAPRDEDFAIRFPREAMELGKPQSAPAEETKLPAEEAADAAPKEKRPAGAKALLSALPFGKKKAGGKKKAKKAEAPRGDALDDTAAYPAAYAADEDYESEEEADPNAFPSFGDYLLGLVTGLWLRLRGVAGSESAETMETEEEELGPELKPAAASRYYGSFVQSLRLRFRIALVLWLILSYISLGLPVTGALRSIQVAAGMCLALQLGIMLLSLDVITGSAINLARARFGADSLAALSCVLTSLDALAVLLDGFGQPHMPLCALSSMSLLGVLCSALLSARGLRKSLRVPAIGKQAYSVTAESEKGGRTVTLIKSLRPVIGFVRRSEEAPPDETAYNRASPLLLVLAFLMSLIVVLAKKSAGDFLYVFTAVLAPATPVTALLCYALPFFVGANRIFPSGAAIAGWSGLCDVGSSNNLIVTDRDLFPEGSVDIDSIRIFADVPSERIIAYAGTMITASGAGLGSCFADLMQRNGCAMRQVENFEFLPGGGMKATIDGQTVLCGGTELMRLMNVRIPYRLVTKTSVLLAIDGVLYGIFNMKYEANPTVRKALIGLIRSNRHPVFAVRDFNINPEMLHDIFDLATDGYDFPPYVERFAISEPQSKEPRKIAAVLCREGLGPLVHMADTGRSLYIAIRINLMISLLAAVVGVFMVFIQFLTAGSVGLGALFFYGLFWLIPLLIVSVILRF